MSTSAAPVVESERYHAIDVLRGVAVLGILVMNIQSFAMPFAAYFNPTALGPPSDADFSIWSFNHLVFDTKMMSIFSMLFGAGVLLMTSRAAARGASAAAVHYRRMFWLLVFGLLHAYLIWYGDILVLYAVCGLYIYLLRNLSARTLLVVGSIVLSVTSIFSIFAGLTIDRWPAEATAELQKFWAPDRETIAGELAAFQGGWMAQAPVRTAYSFGFHSFELWIWGIWRAGGMMLIGMALLKLKVLTGERSPQFYTRLAAAGFGIGLPIIAWGISRNIAAGWTLEYSYFFGMQWNYWGSIAVALGWVGLVMRVWQSGALRGLVTRLGAAGRMAFTCYIAETLICTTVFYGHGLGLFAQVGRAGQMLVVIAVWVVLLTVAPLWLARYRFGPLEWLWRTLTYGRPEPNARRADARVAAT